MHSRKKSISREEAAAREAGVAGAVASVRLEGLEPSEEAHSIFARYAAGELKTERMLREIRAVRAH